MNVYICTYIYIYINIPKPPGMRKGTSVANCSLPMRPTSTTLPPEATSLNQIKAFITYGVHYL